MKTLFTLLIATLALTACNGQSSAIKDQAGVYEKLDEMEITNGLVRFPDKKQ